MNTIQRLVKASLISPPRWLPDNVMYETIMGSVAYGVSGDTSDMDVYGFCIPPKHIVFPHLAGEIEGFGRQKKRFDQYQQHHVSDPSALGGKGRDYDLTIYNIVRYFTLCMECNPNMIDSLYTPDNCVLTATPISQHVRANRDLFLHKGAWHKFKGYSYSQKRKIETKSPEAGSKRQELVEQFGYDVKFAYHLVRLLDEVEQILTEHTLNLTRNREQLKAIRRGEWTQEQVFAHFDAKERELEAVYTASTLRHSPDEPAIKMLLLECLEMHYGTLSAAEVVVQGRERDALIEIGKIVDRALS